MICLIIRLQWFQEKEPLPERKKLLVPKKDPKTYISLTILEPGKRPKHQHAQLQNPNPTDEQHQGALPDWNREECEEPEASGRNGNPSDHPAEHCDQAQNATR